MANILLQIILLEVQETPISTKNKTFNPFLQKTERKTQRERERERGREREKGNLTIG